MKYKIKVRTIWEFGKRVDANGDPHQEDSLFPGHKQATEADRLFILCDGMGGHDKGEVASSTVCETMSRTVLAECQDPEGAFPDIILQNALTNAYNALDGKDSGAQKKMGTTMTFLKLHSAGYTAAHIGDSRIYQFRPGRDKQTTEILFKSEDHSLVNDLVKIGEITEDEAKTHPQRNVITRAMQPHNERRPKADVHHSADIRPGDYFYLCSDGMLEESDDNNLRMIFSDKIAGIDAKTDALTKVSCENKDNHTAFIIEIIAIEGKPTEMIECNEGDCPLLSQKDKSAPLMAQTSAAPVDAMSAATPYRDERMIQPPFNKATQMSASTMASPMMSQKKSNHVNILMYVLVALLVVVIAFIVYVFAFNDKEKKVETDDEPRIENTTPSRHRDAEPSGYQNSAPANNTTTTTTTNVRIIKTSKKTENRNNNTVSGTPSGGNGAASNANTIGTHSSGNGNSVPTETPGQGGENKQPTGNSLR